MKSFLGSTKLKTQMVAEIEKHRKADMIVQGTYGEQNGHWKGCAVGCSLRSLAIIKGEDLVESYNQHSRYETDLGIPEWLARLEDTLFEGLPVEDAKKWPSQFIKAVPVGVDLEPVKWKFGAYLMKENIDRVMTLKISDELKTEVIKALNGVMTLHTNAIKTGVWDGSAAWSAAESAWSAAESARSAAWSAESARSAAWSAARSARSAAWSAARSAARSARSAAESAARSARSAAESAAWSAANIKHSKYLIKLLKASK